MQENHEGPAKESSGDQTAAKLAGLKSKVSSELASISDKIEKEIIQARDWPPPPMVSQAIKQGVLAFGQRAVKLITALEKADVKIAELDRELKDLKKKGPGADSTEVAHLKMENKVLKEHLDELSAAADGGKSLRDENVDLKLKLDNLEAELNRLLVQAADSQEMNEENESLKREINELNAKLESMQKDPKKTSKSGRLLAQIWDMAEVDGKKVEENPELAAMMDELDRLRGDLEKTKKKAEALKAQNENLSSKVMELAEAAALRAESAMEEINSLRDERNMLEQERDRYRSSLENMECGKEAALSTSNPEAEELRRRVAELEEAQAACLDSVKSMNEAVAESDAARASCEDVLATLRTGSTGEGAESRLKKAVIDLISRCEALEKREKDYAREIEGLRKSARSGRNAAAPAGEDMDKVMEALKKRIGELEEELDQKDEELEKHRGETSKVNGE